MRRPRPARYRIPLLALLALSCAVLAAACTGGGAPEPTATPEPAVTTATPEATATRTATPTPAAYDFPTGPAVLVAADYVAPGDRVASTGAYIPSNGKPTLVFVDAIW